VSSKQSPVIPSRGDDRLFEEARYAVILGWRLQALQHGNCPPAAHRTYSLNRSDKIQTVVNSYSERAHPPQL